MKKISTTIAMMSVLFPGLVLAAQDPFDRYVEKMIEEAKENGAVVNVESHSSVSTGGQVAGAGQSATDGDVSSSSHVETRINAGNEGGTVEVKVETTKNGETEKKEYTEEIEPGKPVNVNVSAEVDSEGSEIKADIDGEAAAEDVASDDVDTEVAIMARVESAFEAVPNFFKKVFGFFFGW
jgi:hypothetical protein